MTRHTTGNFTTAALGVCSLLFSALLVAPSAQAAPIADFAPGFIIADEVMYNARSMSEAQISGFITAQGSSCVAAAGNVCLKDYRENTPSRPASAFCPGAYAGAKNESSATIIYKAANACGINPQVLLVILQKEQTLIYQVPSVGRPAATYTKALGFGCPEDPSATGSSCALEYAGFANQVYSAASRLKQYAAQPKKFNHQAGRTNKILFHPNEASCASAQTFIQNQATASLYNYTPYQPNSAALAAGAGQGDACSSYGNRNFFIYFKRWFGDPRVPASESASTTTAAAVKPSATQAKSTSPTE